MTKGVKNSVFAAIYARTSSPNQKFNHSIKEQVDRCWKFCGEREWIVKFVFVDECQSGKSIDRPKFQLMLQKAEADKFNVIVFWKLDRFCRSLVDLINVEKNLRDLGIGLCSVTENLDTTNSVGRFNFRNLASVAELEREMIGERARIGIYALAREHKWPNSHPPLGYDKTEDGALSIDKKEAKFICHLFNRYIETKSMDQVAFELNRRGISTKKGKKWNARTIRDVLTNGIYQGRYKVAGVEDYVGGYRILDDAQFEKAAQIMKRYENGGRIARPTMVEDRKKVKLDKIFNEYIASLSKMEDENG